MRFKPRFCLFALCALAMVLSFMAVGCSDKDREGGSEQIKTKTFTYVYTQSVGTKGVPATAEYIYATAYDSADEEVSAKLADNNAWQNYDDTNKTYSVVTVVDEKTDHMLYTFTSKDESGKEVVVATLPVYDVTSIKDGETYTATDETVEYSCKFYGSDGQELTAGKVTVGDQFSVRVFATDSTAKTEVEVTDVTLTYAPPSSLEEGTDGKYTAKADGPVKFDAEIEEVIYKEIGTITVVNKEDPEADALYLCPAGYTVTEDGTLNDDHDQPVVDPANIPAEITNGVYYKDALGDTTYTFVVVRRSADGKYTDCSNKKPILSVNPTDGITLSGCEMSVNTKDEAKAESYEVGAQIGEDVAVNKLSFKPTEYEYSSYLCPEGYSVKEGTLFNKDGETKVEDIPKDLELTKDVKSTLFVAVYDRDNVLVSGASSFGVKSSDNACVEANAGNTEVNPKATGSATLTACSETLKTAAKNSITATVNEPVIISTYICPSGYSVTNGELFKSDGSTKVETPDKIDSEVTIKVRSLFPTTTTYTFVLVKYNEGTKTWSAYDTLETENGLGIQRVGGSFSYVSGEMTNTFTISNGTTYECSMGTNATGTYTQLSKNKVNLVGKRS